MTVYGPHLLGDLDGCVPLVMPDSVKAFMLGVVRTADLLPMGPVHQDTYSGPHRSWDGVSATVHVETSHVTAHFFAFGYVFLDIFSCRPFDQAKVKTFVEYVLQPKQATWRELARGANFPPNLIDPSMRGEA